MISDNIKLLRKQKGMTQKELADKLFVTSQAVSRWEKGDVEPSVTTIGEIAKIFNVSVDEIVFGKNNSTEVKNNEQLNNVESKNTNKNIIDDTNDTSNTKETIVENNVETKTEVLSPDEVVVNNSDEIPQGYKPVLAVCEHCNNPIFDGNEIVRLKKHSGTTIYCKTCYDNMLKEDDKKKIQHGIHQRKKSFIWGTIIGLIVLALGLASSFTSNCTWDYYVFVVALGVGSFTFSSCLFLQNNFIENVFFTIFSWGFIKFPGLIFSFSLDGFVWLIGMKILFAILGFVISFCFLMLALFVCLILSIPVYPYAIIKSIGCPEESKPFF